MAITFGLLAGQSIISWHTSSNEFELFSFECIHVFLGDPSSVHDRLGIHGWAIQTSTLPLNLNTLSYWKAFILESIFVHTTHRCATAGIAVVTVVGVRLPRL